MNGEGLMLILFLGVFIAVTLVAFELVTRLFVYLKKRWMSGPLHQVIPFPEAKEKEMEKKKAA